MSPETVIHVGRQAVETVLLAASPMLIAAMVIGLLISIFQAATQINEPTIAFVAKAAALTAALFALGSLLLGHLVEFTVMLFQRIPHLIG